MSDTNFTDKVTAVVSSWLQDINGVVYRLLGSSAGPGGAAPTTRAEIVSNLGIATSADLAAFEASLAGSAGASLVGFLQSGTGAVATDLQTRGRHMWIDIVADYKADPTGATNSLNSYIDALGDIQTAITNGDCGYGVIWTPPNSHIRFVGSGAQIPLKSNVIFDGGGYTSFIDGDWNIFLTQGLDRSQLPYYTYYALNNITGPTSVVTFTTTSDAANFSGGIYYIRSNDDTASDSLNPVPTFNEIVKVVSVDTISGTLTLESPITMAVTSPIITNTNSPSYPSNQDSLIENVIIRNMRLKSSSTASGAHFPLTIGAAYKCAFYNLWAEGAATVSMNGLTKSYVGNIRSIINDYGLNFYTGAELKIGSYDSLVENLIVTATNKNSNTIGHRVVSFGENVRDLDVRMIKTNAALVDYVDIIEHGDSYNCRVQDIYSTVHKITQANYRAGPNAASFDKYARGRRVITNVMVSSVDNISLLGDSSGSPVLSHVDLDEIEVIGGTTSGNHTSLNYGLNEITISRAKGAGKIYVNAGTTFTGVRMDKCVSDGPYSSTYTPEGLVVGSGNRRNGDLSKPLARMGRLNVVSTTANNAILTWTYVTGSPIFQNDSFRVRGEAYVYGTNGAKTIEIKIFGTAVLTMSFLSTDNLVSVVFDVDVTMYSGTWAAPTAMQGSYRWWKDSTVSAGYIDVSSLSFASDQTIEVQAWVANASDGVKVAEASIIPRFVENA